MNPQERALLDACKQNPGTLVSFLVCTALWFFCLYDPFTLEDNLRSSLLIAATVGCFGFLAQIANAAERQQKK